MKQGVKQTIKEIGRSSATAAERVSRSIAFLTNVGSCGAGNVLKYKLGCAAVALLRTILFYENTGYHDV